MEDNKIIQFKLRLSEKNHKYLLELNQRTKLPINKIINILISEMDKEYLNYLDYIEDENLTTVKFNITESERLFLLEESSKSGAGKVATEIKYRLLNTINKNKIFTSNELKKFTQSSYEINMVGRNLNQLVKKLNQKEELVDTQEIKETVKEINLRIKELTQEFKKVVIHTNDRF